MSIQNPIKIFKEQKLDHTLNWVGAEGGSIFFGPQGGSEGGDRV